MSEPWTIKEGDTVYFQLDPRGDASIWGVVLQVGGEHPWVIQDRSGQVHYVKTYSVASRVPPLITPSEGEAR